MLIGFKMYDKVTRPWNVGYADLHLDMKIGLITDLLTLVEMEEK